MIAVERQQCIIDALHQRNVVTVGDLSRELDVTEETIRRDLDKLEAQEVIWRVHGGAYLRTPTNGGDVPVDTRRNMCTEEKTQVAKRCMDYIKDDDVLMLDNSTSVLHLATELKSSNRRVTVITNCLAIIEELTGCSQIDLILLGGTMNHSSRDFSSTVTQKFLDQFHAKKAFISCSGISTASGLTDYNENNAAIRRKMLLNSDVRFFMSDTTKVGKSMIHVVGELGLLDYVIVDRPVDQDFQDALEAQHVTFVSCK